MPDMRSVIDHFETAFDWPEAENSGRILPREGVDSDFDAASAVIAEVEGKLDSYLEEQRAHFGNSPEVFFFHSDFSQLFNFRFYQFHVHSYFNCFICLVILKFNC
jgi:hypothetical protein